MPRNPDLLGRVVLQLLFTALIFCSATDNHINFNKCKLLIIRRFF
jgi:hypothetical protein